MESGEVGRDELAALAAVFTALLRGAGPPRVREAGAPLWWRSAGGYVAPGSWR
ncbi:hypothetical protein [Streptomyces sp. DT190]|uniref:hypothetical protein n=1 Tax=Streptomyces sp. DT190 TaxID=3416527 RepID=UPI003CEE9546